MILAPVLGVVQSAHAQAPVDLQYDAPPDCPGRPDFVTAVQSRGGVFTAKSGIEGAHRLSVSIRQQSNGFAGALQVQRHEVTSAAREVQGSTCQEVADALAVVAAIELRPAQDAAPAVAPPSKSETPAAIAATPTSKRVEGFNGRSTWGADEVAVSAGTLHFKPLLSFTISGGVQLGPIPTMVLPRYDGVFQFANVVTTPDGHQRLNGPILRARVGLLGLPNPSYRSGGTTTNFGSGVAFGLGACWTPHYDTQGLMLLACGEFGFFQSGFQTQEADGSRLPVKLYAFGTAGPVLEIDYNLGKHFHLGVKAGADLVAGQFTAQRSDGSRIFETNMWSVHAGLGLGMHF